MFEESGRQRSVFRSVSALDPSPTYAGVVGRDEEIQQIVEAVRPLTRDNPSEDVLVHGCPGVGKTTCVNHVLTKLEEETRVKPVSINCWQYDTRPALLSQLLIELGFPAPRKGKATDALLARLREWLDKNRSVVVVLDEFDQLADPEDIVYDLKHISHEAAHELGLILISNAYCPEELSDARCQSRLDCQPIHFDRYDADDLHAILQHRMERAFRPESISEHVSRLIADMVADQGGDCRTALRLLRRAGRNADEANADKVTAEHVEQLQPQSSDQASATA